MNEIFARVKAFLQAKGVESDPIGFAEDTSTCEKAAAVLGVDVGQIAKTIVFLDNQKRAFIVVASGDVKINSGKLKRQVGSSKVRLADPQTVLELTGYPVGGVCPVALKTPLPIILENTMQRFDVVYASAGTAQSALPLTMEQLQKATEGIWADVI